MKNQLFELLGGVPWGFGVVIDACGWFFCINFSNGELCNENV